MICRLYGHEHRYRQADFDRVDGCDPAANDAFLLQAPDPLPARSGCQANPVGDFGKRERSVRCQQAQDLAIHPIHFLGGSHRSILSPLGSALADSCTTATESGSYPEDFSRSRKAAASSGVRSVSASACMPVENSPSSTACTARDRATRSMPRKLSETSITL